MEIKDIALKLCNLPEGEYEMETKLGRVVITHIRPNERNDYRQVNIKINDELYDEIIYSTFDYFHLWEKIHLKNNEQKYILKHEILENKNEIQYIDENDERFEINNNCIYNYNNSTLAGPSYCIDDGILKKSVTSSDNMAFTYNLENDEKLLHIRKNNRSTQITKENSVTVRGDIKTFIDKYNALINIINLTLSNETEKYEVFFKKFTDELSELFKSYTIPSINRKEVEKLDKEIDKYVNIFKEYAPKLTESHSNEMLEILEFVATTLDNVYNPKQENNDNITTSGKKIFNLTKFKNK